MAQEPAERRVDGAVERLAKVLAGVFFRSVELVGLEKLPAGQPLVLVANHHNSLVDPLLVHACLGKRPRFLAKHTLWEIPGIGQLVEFAGGIPVYRRQDQAEPAKNDETFARCFELLAGGGCIALFPEGKSHDAPHLAELKTGAARIVLESGVRDVLIVPVGLSFDEKGVFRSRALVRVGEPLDPSPWFALHASDPRSAVRALTDVIRVRLEAVTLNYPSHAEAQLIDRAADLFAAGERDLPARMALAEAFALRQAGISLYQRAQAASPERTERVAARIAGYARRLEQLRVRDEHVAARYPSEELAAYVAGSAALLLFWLPLAFIGTLISWIPYRLVGVLARFTKGDDLPATVKLFGGFFLFPLAWIAWAVAAGLAFDGGAAFATLVAAPFTSWFAMRFHERYEHFFEHAAAYARLAWRRREAAQLRDERDALHREVREIRREVDGGRGDGTGG